MFEGRRSSSTSARTARSMNRPEFRRIPRPSCPLFVNLFGETITLSACSEETTIRSAAIEVEKLWGRHRAKKLTEVLTMDIRPTSDFRRVAKEPKATFRADSRTAARYRDQPGDAWYMVKDGGEIGRASCRESVCQYV